MTFQVRIRASEKKKKKKKKKGEKRTKKPASQLMTQTRFLTAKLLSGAAPAADFKLDFFLTSPSIFTEQPGESENALVKRGEKKKVGPHLLRCSRSLHSKRRSASTRLESVRISTTNWVPPSIRAVAWETGIPDRIDTGVTPKVHASQHLLASSGLVSWTAMAAGYTAIVICSDGAFGPMAHTVQGPAES